MCSGRWPTPPAGRWCCCSPAGVPAEESDPDHSWIELRAGTSFVVLLGGDATVGTDSPFVFVDDLDAHLRRARAAGAQIVEPVHEHGYRAYTAADCEGRRWVFAQSGPRIGREPDPVAAGAAR